MKFWPENSLLGKFGPKKLKLSVFPENWHAWNIDDADPYSNISFLNFRLSIHFWANLGQKSQSCLICLRIWTQNVSTIWILIQTLFFLSLELSIFFWTNPDRKIQSCSFWLKIGTHGISRILILIPTIVFLIANTRSSCLFCLKTGTHAHVHTVSRICWFLFRY